MRALLLSLVLLLAGPAHAAEIAPGDWRLVVATGIGDMPINLRLERAQGRWRAAFLNGPERVLAETVAVAGDKLTITFPSFDSRIEATLGSDNAVTGQITLVRAKGPVVRPFTGKAGESHRFLPRSGPAPATVAGRWAVTEMDGDPPSRGIGEFTQDGGQINGAVLYETGDTRYLSGELRGDELYLSTFDGGQGSLWVGRRGGDGMLRGKVFWLGSGTINAWEARADATAQLADPSTLTYFKPGYDRLDFKFPNLEGKPVSLNDPAYKGKVVIVTLGGSWCPTCHDEAAFLAPFYKANRRRGFEVIGLMYELAPAFEKAVSASRNFQKRYDIRWQMLIAGTPDKASAARTLPMLNAVVAYPTMIVIDRKGNVRRIHTSFPGPATGAHHEEFKRDFQALMDELLREKG